MLSRILGGIGRVLIFSGIVLLLFVGYQLWGTALDERGHQEDLARDFGKSLGLDADETEDVDTDDLARSITEKLAALTPETAPPFTAPAEGEPVGYIEIPKIELAPKSFVEGVAKADLRKGPGHYQNTPFPGNAGNAAIAGHRTTYGAPFNRIDELVPGDHINVYTPQGKFVYEVLVSPEERRSGPENENWGQGWFAVRPSDVSVLDQTGENLLTLTACHPKRSAKYRIIVQAKLIADPAEAPPERDRKPVEHEPGSEIISAIDDTDATEEADDAEATGPVDSEIDMIAGDPDELPPAIAWFTVVVALWLGSMGLAWFIRKHRTRTWYVYVGTLAVSAYPLWASFVHMDRYLPSF